MNANRCCVRSAPKHTMGFHTIAKAGGTAANCLSLEILYLSKDLSQSPKDPEEALLMLNPHVYMTPKR